MTKKYEITSQDNGFSINKDGKAVTTPADNTLAVPSQPLAEALAEEWMQHGKFAAGKMPLTTIAQTAIDRVASQRELIIESLLVYVDTDALIYRSNSSKALLDKQKDQWDPILQWAEKTFGVTWEVTQGVMPIDQSEELHDALNAHIHTLDDMQLAACCMLAPSYSSVVLALAVVQSHIEAEEAFLVSRLEEEFQAEIWGRDPEAEKRVKRMREDVVAAGQFLTLLQAA